MDFCLRVKCWLGWVFFFLAFVIRSQSHSAITASSRHVLWVQQKPGQANLRYTSTHSHSFFRGINRKDSLEKNNSNLARVHDCADGKFAFVGLVFPNFFFLYQLHVCYREVGGGWGRREVLNTTEQGARGEEGGGGGGCQTTQLPFCSTSISGIGKESKRSAKGKRKGYRESTTRYKEKN